MIELINLQQTMYMRVTLSDDPEARTNGGASKKCCNNAWYEPK